MKAGEFEEQTYSRASWSGGRAQGRKKRVDRSEYVPCVGCGKPIHPKLHEPDAHEQGRCLKCRSAA
jgi:RNA polymerase-binding transcription factor DksA